MKRYIKIMPMPNKIWVEGENGRALTELIVYSLSDFNRSREFQNLMQKIEPKGEGIFIPEVIEAHWVQDEEDSVFDYEIHTEKSVPDYKNLDIWAINQETPFGGDMFEIEGDELRRLFHEAYQIYVDRGLIKEE